MSIGDETLRQAPSAGARKPVGIRILDARLGRDFPLPAYATPGAAGLDLRAMLDEDRVLAPGETLLVPAGFALEIGDPRLCAQIHPRSGRATREGLVLANQTGIIDSDYQGPVLVPLYNRGPAALTLHVGERVAQMVFVVVQQVRLTPLNEPQPPSARGSGGFGSTGND